MVSTTVPLWEGKLGAACPIAADPPRVKMAAVTTFNALTYFTASILGKSRPVVGRSGGPSTGWGLWVSKDLDQ